MNNRRKISLILSILIVLLVGIRLYFCTQKEHFFIDETFSYSLMNSKYGMIQYIPEIENNWINSDMIYEAITLQKNETFDYRQVYLNQVADCHPPIYYFLLHTISIFSIDNFSMWPGLALNILISIGSFILLFLIGKKVFKDNFYSFLLCMIYGFSLGAIATTLLIRMYELFVFNTLLLIYFAFSLLEDSEFKFKKLSLMTVITVIGFLTHYYFLFIAVPIYLVIFIKSLVAQKFKNAKSCVICGVIAGIISLALYPSCINHIFNNYRGVEAFDNLTNIGTYLADIKSSIHIISNYLFCSLLIPLGIVIFITYIYIYNKYKKENLKIKINFKFVLLTCTILFYFLIVTKIAPYKAERYFVPIFPLIYIVFIGIIKLFFDTFVKSKKITYILITTISLFFIITNIFLSTNILYLYKGTNQIYQPVYEFDCDNLVYLYDTECYTINNDIIKLINFDNLYISNISNLELINDLNSKEKIVLYIPFENSAYVNFIVNNSDFNNQQYISSSWYGDFYLLTK